MSDNASFLRTTPPLPTLPPGTGGETWDRGSASASRRPGEGESSECLGTIHIGI